ncbi:MAG: LytTR family transcriptional regulator DNA-binding domain-containing protein, partial [Betaproteobacteria bacterium]|nr:LytTR family transcriptional regulator DNA-binding domain-containing protein [Betaproteobacteria bacterium]
PPKPTVADAVAAAAEAKRRHFSIHERGKIVLVPFEEVLFLRAEQKYITVRTATREHLMEDSLTRIEEEFGDAFIRIHRNSLVAKAYIAGFERAGTGEDAEGGAHWVVVLRGLEEKLPVSRRQQHIVREF